MTGDPTPDLAADLGPGLVPDGEALLDLPGPLDMRLTVGIHGRGGRDPALHFEVSGSCWRATRTPDGPVTLLAEARAARVAGIPGHAIAGTAGTAAVPGPGQVRVRAWGPGAQWAIASAPGLLGFDDDPSALEPRHEIVARVARARPGLRIGWTGAVLEALVPAILGQKVTVDEARRAWTGLSRRYGEDAPGPPGLRLPPSPAVLAALPYHAYHPLGIERRRADLVRAVCREAVRLERAGAAAAGAVAFAAAPEARASAYAALRGFPGIGPWTAAEVGARAFGDPDAVSVGDFHVPNLVAWALAGEPRGTDERMLELLEPYRGQRGRVIRLLKLSGIEAPRYGPRLPTHRIDHL